MPSLFLHNITTRPVNPTTGEKEYKVQDHLGSTRLIIAESGTVAGQYDYDAWGEVIWQSDTPPRKGFIDKEKDAESGDHNFGVRQYRDGKFWNTDPDWEKYRAWSPYNYAENNPLKFKDPSGFGPGDVSRMQPAWTNEYNGGIIGGSGGNGGVSIGQIVGAAVAGVLGYVFAENVVGSEGKQYVPPPVTTAPGEGKTEPALPTSPYAPDRPLPVNKETGEHISDSDAPHTQLGTRKSESQPGQTYPQSREWDGNGNKVRDIDWTDHGRPKQHTNPHQHRWNPETGKREGPQPVDSAPVYVPSYSVPSSSRPSDI